MSKARIVSERNGGKDEETDGNGRTDSSPDPQGTTAPGTDGLDHPDEPATIDDLTVESSGYSVKEKDDGWMKGLEARTEDEDDDGNGFFRGFEDDFDRDREGCAPGAEWIMAVDEYGQILVEMPENQAGGFDDVSGQVKEGLGDHFLMLENEEPGCDSVFDVCSPDVALKQNLMLLTQDDGKAIVEALPVGCSISSQIKDNIDLKDEKSELESPDLLCSIEVNMQNPTQESDLSVNCLDPVFGASMASKIEAERTNSVLNHLPKATYFNLISLSDSDESKSLPVVSEQECSVHSFDSEVVVDSKLKVDQSKTSHEPNYIDESSGIILPIKGSETHDELSVMNLFPETPFISNGTRAEIVQNSTANSNILKSFQNCISLDASDTNSHFVNETREKFEEEVPPLSTEVDFSGKMTTGLLNESSSSMKLNKLANLGNVKNLTGMPLSIKILKRTSTFSDEKEFESPAKRMVLVKKSSVVLPSAPDVETTSNTQENLNIESSQGEAKRFVCSHEGCDWSFPTAYKLKRHEEAHTGKKDFVCDFEGCNRKFTTIYNLNTHKKLHELPCTVCCPRPDCSEVFRNRRLLDKHLKLHGDGEKMYSCPFPGCTKSFFSQSCITSHARVHQHDSVMVCAFEGCGRKFDKLCRLRQHMRSHTGERPYRCTFEGCNWAFSTSSKLCRHLVMHNGQKKFQCPFVECGKMFTRAEHVRGHMVTHTTQRPFPCVSDGCNAKFKSKNSLEIHLKRYCQAGKASNAVDLSRHLEECDQGTNKAHLDRHDEQMDDPEPGNTSISIPIESLPMMISLDLEGLDNIVQNHQSSSSAADHSLFLGQALPTVVCSTTTSTLNLLTLPVLVSSESSSITSHSSSSTLVSGFGKADFSRHQKKTKRKNPETTDDLNIGLTIIDQMDESAVLLEPQHSTSRQMAPSVVLNMDEIMTSHAITFRDPETGTIYVQTQLLQDDPPNTDMYLDGEDDDSDVDVVTTGNQMNIMLHDDFTSNDSDEVTFSGTTINLQDLE